MNNQLINERYRIVRKIGSGGMGIVYLVEDTYKDNMPFAVKTIRQKIMANSLKSLGVKTFKNEYEIMTRLKHPNLTRVYDFEEDSDNYYIIMEYLKGRLLSDYKSKLVHSGLREKLDIIIQILRALEYIHSRNIIYRDVKPSNIMIVNNKVKLLDFGLSASVQHKEDTIRGTLLYLSPDILRGELNYSVDIFSLGILLYEIIQNESFYKHTNLTAQIILEILKNRKAFNSYRQSRLQQIKNIPLRTIIDKMTAYTKAERYGACSEIIAEINGKSGYDYEYETSETKLSYVLGNAFANRRKEYTLLTSNIRRGNPIKMSVFVAPPGAGKTRLFVEFKKYCRLNEIPFFESNCMEAEFRTYYSIGEILTQMMPAASLHTLNRFGKYIKLILPHSAKLQTFKTPDIGDNPKKLQAIIVQNISDFMFEFAKEQDKNIIVYFNDIQWIDSGSELILENLLYRLVNSERHARNLLVYANLNEAKQPEDTSRFGLLDIEGVTSYQLPPLDAKGVSEYVANIFGSRFIDTSINDAIHAMHHMVGGSPLYLEALIRSLIEANLIVKDKQYWKLLKPLSTIKAPGDIVEILKKKIEYIFKDDAKRKILKILSLLRIDVHLDIIKSIIAKLSPIHTARILLELENLEILQSVKMGGTVSYRFSGSLIKEIIRQSIDIKDELSLFLATTLEECVPDNEDYTEEIAYQYLAGGKTNKAIIFYEKCAENAKKHYFNQKALEHYEIVLTLLKSTSEKNRLKEIEIKTEIANILKLTGNWENAETFFLECIDLSKEAADKQLLAQSYMHYGELMYAKGEYEHALRYYEKSDVIFKQISDKAGEGNATGNMGITYNELGEYKKALAMLEKKVRLSRQSGDKKGLGAATGSMGSVYLNLGNYSKALECYVKYKDIAEDIGDRRSLGIAVANMGIIYYHQGNYAKALECYEIDKHICEEIGDKVGLGITISNMGLVYKSLGRYAEALECYGTYKKIAAEIGDKRGVGATANNMGNLYRMLGKYQQALECYLVKNKLAEEAGDKRGIGIASGNMGLLYHYQGKVDKALEYFKKQKAIFQEIGFKRGQAIAQAGIGEAYFSLSKHDLALRNLDRAISLFEALNITDDDYVGSLLTRAKILFLTHHIADSAKTNKRALTAAVETGNTYQRINAIIQGHIIASSTDKQSAVRSLLDLLQNEGELTDDQRADVYYELYFLEGGQTFKQNALRLFSALYSKVPSYLYKKKIDRLNSVHPQP